MKIIIKKNDDDEYEVPTSKDCAIPTIYYTDDLDDAIATAKYEHGDDAVCVVKRGTYGG